MRPVLNNPVTRGGPGPEPDARPVSGRSVLAVVALWTAAAAVLATAGYLAASRLTNDAEAPTLAAVLLAYLALPAAAFVIYRPSGMRNRLAVRDPGWRGLGSALIAWLLTLATSAIVYLLIGTATGNATGPGLDVIRDATDQARFAGATPLDWTLIVPRALLLAGITEELLFRGILFGWLRQHLPAWAVILITAGLFALEHGYYPILVPIGLIFGLTAGWLRHRGGSILPGLAMHLLTDGLLFTLALIAARR